MDLTKEECNILIEAVDSWVDKDFGHGLMSTLLSSLVSDKASPETKQKIAEKEEVEELKRKTEKEMRKERAIILKAKLLKIRDKIEAEDFCNKS